MFNLNHKNRERSSIKLVQKDMLKKRNKPGEGFNKNKPGEKFNISSDLMKCCYNLLKTALGIIKNKSSDILYVFVFSGMQVAHLL